MKTMEDLSVYVQNRLSELEELKKQGVKIVGYIPTGFMPTELVWAGGAIPIALNRGGDQEAVLKSMEYIPRFIDTYSRSQIGYWALGEALYRMIDLIVVPCTDKNISAIADCWEMWTDTKLFRLGVPHNNTTEHAFKFYRESLDLFKEEIEKLTGRSITESKLKEEIEVSNKVRSLFRQIRETCKSDTPPIRGSDFIKLQHSSFVADRHFMAEYLESLYQNLKHSAGKQGPRVFIIGSSIAEGDYKIYDLLESAGANVVIEDFSEGMSPYWPEQDVQSDGDLVEALADAYFKKRTPPPAFFRPARGRRDFLFNLAREFRVDGIVWYSMLFREAHEIEGIHFGRSATQQGYHFIRITSDYDNSEYEPLRTRIEAFVESISM